MLTFPLLNKHKQPTGSQPRCDPVCYFTVVRTVSLACTKVDNLNCCELYKKATAYQT